MNMSPIACRTTALFHKYSNYVYADLMITHRHVFELKNAIDKHDLRMRIFLCQFCACEYFAPSLENCCISLLS